MQRSSVTGYYFKLEFDDIYRKMTVMIEDMFFMLSTEVFTGVLFTRAVPTCRNI